MPSLTKMNFLGSSARTAHTCVIEYFYKYRQKNPTYRHTSKNNYFFNIVRAIANANIYQKYVLTYMTKLSSLVFCFTLPYMEYRGDAAL